MSPQSRRAPAIAAALLLLSPLSADAQGTGTTTTPTGSGNIKVTPDSLGGDEIPAGEQVYIGVAHCSDDADLVLQLDQVPSGSKESLDVYLGSNCTATTRDTEEDSNCTFIANEQIGVNTSQQITISSEALALSESEACEGGTSEEVTLWLLAVDDSQGNEPVTNADFGTLKLRIDLQAPEAATNVRGGSGENEIPVSWDFEDTSESIERFIVLVDPGAGGSVTDDAGTSDGGVSECGSGVLVPGASSEGLPTTLRQKRVDNPAADSTTVSADDLNGDVAAVAVVAVDKAGNRGAISNVACLRVVPTTGYKDLYEQQTGEPIATGCPCSAPGRAQAEGALPIVLALGLIVARARRRRS